MRPEGPLPREAADGFSVTAELLRQTLSYDRKATATLAIHKERLGRLEHEVARLVIVVERGNGRVSLQQLLEHLSQHVSAVEAWQARQEQASTERTRGQWQVIAVLVTAASGLLLGVANLLWK